MLLLNLMLMLVIRKMLMLIHVDISRVSLNVRISEVRNNRDHQQLTIVIFLYHKFEFYQNFTDPKGSASQQKLYQMSNVGMSKSFCEVHET